MADVKLSNIRKSFGPVDIIKGVDLEINAGEFVVFVGPSGCGKSTLLRMICGLEQASSGDIHLDGVRVNNTKAAKLRKKGEYTGHLAAEALPDITVKFGHRNVKGE